jgi:hypothetical protein
MSVTNQISNAVSLHPARRSSSPSLPTARDVSNILTLQPPHALDINGWIQIHDGDYMLYASPDSTLNASSPSQVRDNTLDGRTIVILTLGTPVCRQSYPYH